MNILITGATSGIGKSIAETLSNQGHRVFGFGRRVQNEINETGISWITMDVINEESVLNAISLAYQNAGKIDILIQCAGKGAIGPVEEFKSSDIEEVFQLNLLGIHRVNQAVLPRMRKQGFGKIFLTSSLASESGLPYHALYCASKAALDVYTESLRLEIAQFGIQACVVQPGDFKTEVAEHRQLPNISTNSPYFDQFNRINKTATDNVAFARDPQILADRISQLIHKRKLKPKYRVGAPLEVIMPKAKTILPSSWFEKLLMKYYKL